MKMDEKKRITLEQIKEEEFCNILKFYLFYCPCKKVSEMGKTLEEYGWHAPWSKPYSLSHQLKQVTGNKNLIYPAPSSKTLNIQLKEANLLNTPKNGNKEVICIVDTKKNHFMSIFAHIRNSLAHGRFHILEEKEVFFVFEDKYRKKLTARMVLKKKTLLEWIKIIEGKEKPYEKEK